MNSAVARALRLSLLAVGVATLGLLLTASPAAAIVADGGGGSGGGGSTGGGNQRQDSYCITRTVSAPQHFGTRTERYQDNYRSGTNLHLYQMPYFGPGQNCFGGTTARWVGWTSCPSGIDVWRFYATGTGRNFTVQYFSASQSHSLVHCDPRYTRVTNLAGSVASGERTVYTSPHPDDAGVAGAPWRHFSGSTWNSGPSTPWSLSFSNVYLSPNQPHFRSGSTSGLAANPNPVRQMLDNEASRDMASESVFALYQRYASDYGFSLAAAHANLTAPPSSAAQIPGLYNSGRTAFASPLDLARDPNDRTQVLYGVCYQPRDVPARIFDIGNGQLRASAYAFNPSSSGLMNSSSSRYVTQPAANDAGARALYGDSVVNDVRARIEAEVSRRDARGANRVGRALSASEWSSVRTGSYPAMPAINQAQAGAQARQQATCIFGNTSSVQGGEQTLTPQIPVRGNIGVTAPDSFVVQGTFGEGVITTTISTAPDCGRMPCSPAPELVSVRFNPRLVSSDPSRYQVCEPPYREGCGAVVTSIEPVSFVRTSSGTRVPVQYRITAQFYNATPNGVSLRVDTSDARTVWQPYQILRVCEPYLDFIIVEPGLPGRPPTRTPVIRQNCYDVTEALPRVTLTPGNGITVTGNDPRLVVRSIVTR